MRSGRKRGKQNGAKGHELEKDTCHSLDVPSCSLVKQVMEDVLPKRDSKSKAEASIFGNMVMKYLLDQQKQKETEPPTPTKRRNKKRRKKKKAKAQSAAELTGTEAAEALTVATAEVATLAEASSQDAAAFPVAAVAVASKPDPVKTDFSSRFNAERMASDLLAANVTRWMKAIKLEQLTEIDRDLATFISTIESLPTISKQDISNALNSIGCDECKASAESYWTENSPFNEVGVLAGNGVEVSKTLVLRPEMIIPRLSREEDDVERAFDYVAMEEGLGVEESYGEDTLVLKPQNDESKKVLEVAKVPRLETVSQMLLEYVFPCGLPSRKDQQIKVELVDKEYKRIIQQTLAKEKQIESKQEELRERLLKLQTEFDATEPGPLQTSSDLMVSTTLRDCDEHCDQIMVGLLEVILQIHECYHQLSCSVWVEVKTEQIWQAYDSCVQRMLNAVIGHEGKLIQLSNRPGKIPAMFLDVSHRSSFRSMVSEKLRSITDLFRSINAILNREVDSDYASYLKKVVTNESFAQLVLNRRSPRERVDELHFQILKVYNELTQVVHSGNVEGILTKKDERCDRLIDLLGEAEKAIAEDYQVHQDSLVGLSMSGWDDLQRQHEDASAALKLLAQTKQNPRNNGLEDDGGDEDEEVVEDLRQRCAAQASYAIARWRCLASLKSSARNAELPALPTRLNEWMSSTNDRAQRTGSNCCGGGGKRRVTSILVCLIYQWLADRAQEWHAELTEKELLESMDESLVLHDVDTNERNKTSKSKKRKKKKSSHGGTSKSTDRSTEGSEKKEEDDEQGDDPAAENGEGSNSNETESTMDLVSSSTLDDDTNYIRMDTPAMTTITTSDSKEEEEARENAATVETAVKSLEEEPIVEDSTEALETADVVEEDALEQFESKETEATPTEQQSSNEGDVSRIVVVDDSGTQSVEDFLVGRLTVLLTESDRVKIL